MNSSKRIVIKGLVQGIGYRPFVAELAEEYQITGWVKNTAGIVTIWAEGNDCHMEQFLLALSKEAPEGAQVDCIEEYEEIPQGYMDFRIEASEEQLADRVVPFIPPDLPTCPVCRRQLFDRRDRRYRYPFISCTACGPRYSILETLPYDRPNITMRDFPMCSDCWMEYIEKGNIRRHAQTIACDACGPKLYYREYGRTPEGEVTKEDAFRCAAQALQEEGIVAVRDIGGFHLACSPYSTKAVEVLRRIKGREKKPFAVMFADIHSIQEYCEINDAEKEQLLSAPRPIVLLKKKETATQKAFSLQVCQNSPDIGVMLPCNPLQLLLVNELGPLVMTSANRSGELIITQNEKMAAWLSEAEKLLERKDIRLGMLSHNRRILTPMDDSIVRIVCGRRQVFRRARGMVPVPIEIKGSTAGQPLFAAGGDLKACFCYAEGGRAYLSQHFGDLEDEESYQGYRQEVKRMKRLFGFEPKRAVADLHPAYLSAAMLLEEKEPLTIQYVQHHHAHAAAVLAEHAVTGRALCTAFDGTGYGLDGSVWGSEFFLWNGQQMERVAHLLPVRLPGGDAGAKNADAILYGYFASFSNAFENQSEHMWERLPWLSRASAELVQKAIHGNINSVVSSSMGRLFDAVSALLNICHYNSYEGEAAIELEYLAAATPESYPLVISIEEDAETQKLIGNTQQLFATMIQALCDGVPKEQLARGFLLAVAGYIRETMERLAEQYLQPQERRQAVLSGGTFQNRILLESVIPKLEAAGFTVYINEQVPPGDGGICLGQAYLHSKEKISIEESGGRTMCVAIPGKVLTVEEGKAVVDFSGNQVTAYTGLVSVKPGDYVLVHAGCVIQTMKQQEAEEIIELMRETENENN